jgi:hypothetical protein
MKWLTFSIQREPGFRLNLSDILLLAALVGVSVAWYRAFPYQGLYWLPIYLGGSFFLFCNVFRIGDRLEVPWYSAFTVITVYGFRRPEFPWLLLLGVCEACKWALIGFRIRRGPYVGAFRRQLGRFSAA